MKVAYTINDEQKQIELSPSKDGWTVVWKDWSSITPLFDYVLIEKDEERKTTTGGLVIPDSVKERPSTGTVIAVGDGAITDDGKVSKMYVSVGDRIIFPKFAGQTIKLNDEEKTILKQSEILGIIQ